ncbi:MAG: YihY/virulence factor BrkB family protein [Actinomycetota bacterium]
MRSPVLIVGRRRCRPVAPRVSCPRARECCTASAERRETRWRAGPQRPTGRSPRPFDATARPWRERRSGDSSTRTGRATRARSRTSPCSSHCRASFGLIGLAAVLGVRQLRLAVQRMASTLAPGPSGKLLQQVASHGASSGATAAVFGLAAALVATTLAMSQVERSANRLAGVADRRGAQRYLTAFGLAVSAGLLLALGGLILAGGEAVATGLGWKQTGASIWAVARWPLGAVVVTCAIYLLFRAAPRHTIRPRRAVWTGAAVAVVLWVLFTAGLAFYLSVGGGQTYGSLIAVVALLLWAVLASLAMHLGLSVAYELESRMRPGSVRLPDSDVVPTNGRSR